jgi:nucleoside-diphosphate-sugar epimerase
MTGEIVVRALRDGEHKVTVTDVHDIGRVLARIVMGDVDAENRVVYAAGDTVSYAQLADIVSTVSRKKVERVAWGIPHLQEELSRNPEDGIKKYRLVFAREGVYWDKEKTANAKLDMNMVDIETYARKLFASSN